MSKKSPIPQLEIIFGPNKGEIVKVDVTPWLVGRDSTCNYVVERERLSRQHAQITSTHGHWFLKDLQSTNGTFLNNYKLVGGEEKSLVDGDKIQLGKIVVFRFIDPAKTIHETFTQVLTPGIWMNTDTQEVFVQMKLVLPTFTPQDFALLFKFTQNPGIILSNQDIIELLWPSENPIGITNQAIDTRISRIKKRLLSIDPDHNYIETVRGAGRRYIPREQ